MGIWRKYLHMQKQLKKTKIKIRATKYVTKVNWCGDLTKIFMQKQLKKNKGQSRLYEAGLNGCQTRSISKTFSIIVKVTILFLNFPWFF